MKTTLEVWQMIYDPQMSWVLFENGTCVVLPKPEGNLADQAIEFIAEWGPVSAGNPAGDFTVLELKGDDGWVVLSHRKELLTHVSKSEVETDEDINVSVGLYGRSKRHKDSQDRVVVHVSDNRDAT